VHEPRITDEHRSLDSADLFKLRSHFTRYVTHYLPHRVQGGTSPGARASTDFSNPLIRAMYLGVSFRALQKPLICFVESILAASSCGGIVTSLGMTRERCWYCGNTSLRRIPRRWFEKVFARRALLCNRCWKRNFEFRSFGLR